MERRHVMSVSARHVDTCYSDFLQDSYSRDGQYLTYAPWCGLSAEDAVDSMMDEINGCDAGIPEDVTDEKLRAALADAIDGVDLGSPHGEDCEDEDGCTGECMEDGTECNVYVVLEWEETDEIEPMMVSRRREWKRQKANRRERRWAKMRKRMPPSRRR